MGSLRAPKLHELIHRVYNQATGFLRGGVVTIDTLTWSMSQISDINVRFGVLYSLLRDYPDQSSIAKLFPLVESLLPYSCDNDRNELLDIMFDAEYVHGISTILVSIPSSLVRSIYIERTDLPTTVREVIRSYT